MSFTKFASLEVAEVLDVKGSPTKAKTASLDKLSDFDAYRTEDGYLYARIRAISSRVNKNHDGWPSVELAGGPEAFERIAKQSGLGSRTARVTVAADSKAKYGYSTFLGKPIFVDHNNSDPGRARGVIVDAKLHIEDHKTAAEHDSYYDGAPDNHQPPTWVELLLEVDAKSFPRLAAAIIEGSNDPDKGIDGFSMGCFVPGTPITLADGTRKPIEAIELGDEVLTHTGKTELVTYLMKRKHEGSIYQIDTYGAAQAMLLTEEHPVWTKNGWVEAKDIKEGDHVLTPRLATQGHPGSFAFARLLGYYLAEGNLMRDKKRFVDGRPVSVEWNFHADEVEFVEEVQTLLDAIGYRAAGPYVKNGCATIRCNSPELAQRFLDYGNQYSWAKRLHPEVMSWNVDNQRALLSAYFNGDGHFRHEGRVEVGTASKTLAEQLQVLATRVGYRMTPPVKQHSPSAAHKHPKYSMQATLVKPDSRTETNCHLDEQGLWRRVTKTSIKEYDGHVYNFDVEGDDSYVAADCAVHNCDVEKSVCNICKNAASSPDEYCKHVKLKGHEFPVTDPKTGKKTSKKSYEDCYGIKFFEISAVFDPADETALLREVRSSVQKEGEALFPPCPNCGEVAGFENYPWANNTMWCKNCQHLISPEDLAGLFNTQSLDVMALPETGHPLGDHVGKKSEYLGEEPHVQPIEGEKYIDQFRGPEPSNRVACPECQGNGCPACNMTGEAQATGGTDGFITPYRIGPDDGTHAPYENYNGIRNQGSVKTAQAPEPDSNLLHVPESVDTLRKEEICQVCGSDMDNGKCEVCGYTEPPDGFDNPDLHKKDEDGPIDLEGEDQVEPEPGSTPPTSNLPMTAHTISDMSNSWNVSLPSRVSTPNTEEPDEEIIEDPQNPVTSKVATAEDFIAAAGAARRNMNTHTADAASGAPADAKPDVRTDVEGVGGVDQASNEAASEADAQIDVEGAGGTPVTDVSADATTSVDQGDEHSKNIESIPTKTFDKGDSKVERQNDPVTSEPFPANGDGVKSSSSWQVTALESDPFPRPEDAPYGEGGGAVQGTQPADPVGKAEDRVDVLQPTTSPDNNSGATKTWSGTDGNGVTKQQDPTTNETLEGEDGVKHAARLHMLAAFRLAELETEIGITSVANKFQRVAELEQMSAAQVESELAYAQKVKTAHTSGRLAGTRSQMRVPSLQRSASTHVESASQEVELPDEFAFGA